MVGLAHYGGDVGRMGGAAAMHLNPDLHIGLIRRPATLGEGSSNLLQGALGGNIRRQIIGPHLDALASQIGDELNELPARLEVALHDVLVR
jgi:hypothetical protein